MKKNTGNDASRINAVDREAIARWIEIESKRVGGIRKLASLLGREHPTLMKWKNMAVEFFHPQSLKAIVEYRHKYEGMPLEAIHRWLSGEKEASTTASGIPQHLNEFAKYVEFGPIDQAYIELIAVGQNRINRAMLEMKKQLESSAPDRTKLENIIAEIQPGAYAVGKLIRKAIEDRGYNPNDPGDIDCFLAAYPTNSVDLSAAAAEIEHLKSVIRQNVSLLDDRLIDPGFLAATLSDWSNTEYSDSDILRLNERA